jgi:hypothetical protein
MHLSFITATRPIPPFSLPLLHLPYNKYGRIASSPLPYAFYAHRGSVVVIIIQLMVYGRILYNNIKEYTPKWFPTIPYSQTVKPVFGTRFAI